MTSQKIFDSKFSKTCFDLTENMIIKARISMLKWGHRSSLIFINMNAYTYIRGFHTSATGTPLLMRFLPLEETMLKENRVIQGPPTQIDAFRTNIFS